MNTPRFIASTALFIIASATISATALASEGNPINDPYGLRSASGEGSTWSEFKSWLERLLVDHPSMRAAQRRLESAEARIEGARGAFDFELTARGGIQPVGKYDEAFATLGFDQPTELWGLRARGGYRQGADYPVYKGGSVTGEGGEFFVDLSLPLWRDRDIDSRRYKLWSAALKRDAEALKVTARRLDLSVAAVHAYWNWVKRLWEVRVAARLRDFAAVREGQIGGRVRSGQAPAIEAVDNRRLVLAREARVLAAEARVAQALAELGLYRADWPSESDAAMTPDLPAALMGLPSVAPLSPEKRVDLKRQAATTRPDMAVMRQVGEMLRLDLRLAENALGPRLDLKAWARQDIGPRRQLGLGLEADTSTEIGVGVEFGLPVQQRAARGEILAVQAELAALDEDIRFAEARIGAALDGLFAELDALAERARLALLAYDAAVELERAERRSFELGQSTLVVVNLREEATAEAALQLVEARAGWLVTMARVMATAGLVPQVP